MKVFRDESGQMLVFTVLTMTALLGFLALATDVGTLFRAKRQLQIAADAAATAGAMDVMYGNANYVADARTASAANGATNGVNGTVVTVVSKPTSGYHQVAGYVEVDITQPNPTYFMKVFHTLAFGTSGFNSVTIGARAVAGAPGYNPTCVYLDGQTGNDLDMQGSAYIGPAPGSGIGCAMYVNSSSSNAVSITGGSATANLSAINVYGTGSGSPNMPNSETVNYNAAPQSDPFGSIVTDGEPSLSDCTSANTQPATVTSFSGKLNLGGGANALECFAGTNVDISGATLEGGTFLFENGVTIADKSATQIGPPPTAGTFTSPADAATLGATIDLYNGVFNQSTASSFNIVAPTAKGQWNNGIALLIPSTNTQYSQTTCSHNPNDTSEVLLQFGSSTGSMQGFIYAPNATIELHDQGGDVSAYGLIAANLCLIPSTLYLPSYNAANPNTTPLAVVALVE